MPYLEFACSLTDVPLIRENSSGPVTFKMLTPEPILTSWKRQWVSNLVSNLTKWWESALFEVTYHIWIQILSSFFKLHRIGLGIGENFIRNLGNEEVQTYGRVIGLREEDDASQFNYASNRWVQAYWFFHAALPSLLNTPSQHVRTVYQTLHFIFLLYGDAG